MEENRKGPGVFYAVVGVATLVVAIIGATFAYFSATVTESNNLAGTTAEGSNLTLKITPVVKPTLGLIPMADSLLDTALDATPNACVDKNGNTVCHVYEVEFTNGANPVDITGSVTFAQTAANISYELLDLTKDSKITSASAMTASGSATLVSATPTATLETSKNFGNGEVRYYYFVVWLHETGSAQDSVDANAAGSTDKGYTGSVTFNAVGTNAGVTATFSG